MRRVRRALAASAAAAFACLVYIYLTVPDVRPLLTSNPKTTAFMEIRSTEARERGRNPKPQQRWVRYNQISEHLKRGVLLAEDSAFWQHEGVDVEQLRVSVEINLETGRLTRGGSTITQQLAKNLYLSPSKNPLRKLREFFIARRLEAQFSKRRILEIYLNVIEWGDGIYGAEAAARRYFGVSAAALGPDEAALLAASIINPRLYSPAHPNARLLRRQRLIRARMGAVTPPPALATAPESGSEIPPLPPVAEVPAQWPPEVAPVEPAPSPVLPSRPPLVPSRPPG